MATLEMVPTRKSPACAAARRTGARRPRRTMAAELAHAEAGLRGRVVALMLMLLGLAGAAAVLLDGMLA